MLEGIAVALISAILIWLGQTTISRFSRQWPKVHIKGLKVNMQWPKASKHWPKVSIGKINAPCQQTSSSGILERRWKVNLKFHNKTDFKVGNFRLLASSHRYGNKLQFPAFLEGFGEHETVLPILERPAVI